ncbi:MAG TPA: MXAN_2755 family glutamic-type intramembrane protease [Myxococcaceae bacterium]|nr:MXAN_2755 family glutamic-type intramembrane protease [Myxococcaceae bacterium]
MKVLSRPFRLTAMQEALWIWLASFLAILVASIFLRRHAKLIATIAFLYLPLLAMNRREETYQDYGVTLRKWREDLKLAALLFALIVPLYFAAYLLFAQVLPHLPRPIASYLWPYGAPPHFRARLPANLDLWVLDQLFVVALPEEFFYRGYLQTRLRDAMPQGRFLLGARLGPAFFLTAALFAVGHLAVFDIGRLAVFFPALLFGWLRERTGTVIGSGLLHAACNIYEIVLRLSFFSGG